MNSLGSADFILNCFNSSYPKHNSTINYPKPNINHENNTMNLNYSNMDESLHKYEENQTQENDVESMRISNNLKPNFTHNSKSENTSELDYSAYKIDPNGNKFYYKEKESFESGSEIHKNLNDFGFVVRFDIKTIIIIILIILTLILYYKYNYYRHKYLKHTYNLYKNNEQY